MNRWFAHLTKLLTKAGKPRAGAGRRPGRVRPNLETLNGYSCTLGRRVGEPGLVAAPEATQLRHQCCVVGRFEPTDAVGDEGYELVMHPINLESVDRDVDPRTVGNELRRRQLHRSAGPPPARG